MTVFESKVPLEWGSLDVPLLGITRDWNGAALDSPAGYALVQDPLRLWFLAMHRKPAALHPKSRPGLFMPGLWDADVAELFIADPSRSRYFEFNLSPNAAWWSCEFKAPRVREEEIDIAFPEVETFAELAPDGGWVAGMAIPLDLLKARVDFGPSAFANVTFILGNPDRRFLTSADLGGGEPDFHRPSAFAKIHHAAIPPR